LRSKISISWSWVFVVSVSMRRALGDLHLAEAELGLGLGAVAGDHLGDRPVLPVGDQDPFAEFLVFELLAGGGIDGPGEPAPALARVWSRPRDWAACRVGEWVSTTRRSAP
jgi:hypothetical protein